MIEKNLSITDELAYLLGFLFQIVRYNNASEAANNEFLRELEIDRINEFLSALFGDHSVVIQINNQLGGIKSWQ